LLFFERIVAVVVTVSIPVVNLAAFSRVIVSAVAVLSVFEFVQVFDVVLEHQQIGTVSTVKLDATAVVPFDTPSQLLTILKHDDHRGPVVHLLFIVKALGVSLLRGYALAVWIALIPTMLVIAIPSLADFGKGWSYQFPVHSTSSSR
jgi:hypothetical protein